MNDTGSAKTIATIAAIASLLIGDCGHRGAVAATQMHAEQHFFPYRPARARLHTITGVLFDFGLGNASGSVVIKTATSKTELYAGAGLRLDGRRVACDHPPVAGRKRSIFCTSWPKGVVLGKTVVTATYWRQRLPGYATSVDVTDELRTKPRI
jgi:hypothetical protein